MRILAITNLYPNPFQPVRATFNRQQFKAIATRCPMRVISPIAWTDEWRLRKRNPGALNKSRQTTCDGLTVDHPRYLFPPKILRGGYGSFFEHSVKKTFNRAVDEFRPDVVLASWAYPDGLAAVRLARQAGLPVVVKVHGSDVLLLSKSKRRGKLTAEALKDADGVIAVSRDLQKKVIELGVDPDKVRLVYNGVDTNVFHPGCAADARRQLGLPIDRRVLLFVGNLAPVKGIDVLIRACKELATKQPDFVCYIIGAGPLQQSLLEQISAAGLQQQVKMVGQRPHSELPAWFRAADVFVLPSYSEGVPNVLLEASACGTRFVATRVGGIPEITEPESGRLVEAGNADSLAWAIRETVESPPSREPAKQLRSHEAAAADVIDFLQDAMDRTQALAVSAIPASSSFALPVTAKCPSNPA